MKVTDISVNVNTDNPARLIAFYRDVVGLELIPDAEERFQLSPSASLVIDTHSETAGPTKEPSRVLLDLFVADLATEQRRLEDAGVKFSRSAGVEFWGGIISTFADPVGNIVQLIEYNPAMATPEPAATTA